LPALVYDRIAVLLAIWSKARLRLMREFTIGASDFRARCLRTLEEVAERGDIVIVTRRGKPLAKLVPLGRERKPLKGRWKGLAKTIGDIVYFDTSEEWEVPQQPRRRRRSGSLRNDSRS
jgi:prevent-host-death family protein